jgi:hypothetical protein
LSVGNACDMCSRCVGLNLLFCDILTIARECVEYSIQDCRSVKVDGIRIDLRTCQISKTEICICKVMSDKEISLLGRGGEIGSTHISASLLDLFISLVPLTVYDKIYSL